MGCCTSGDKVRSYVTNDFELLPQGEPLTYDKSFKGPRESRSCTDVPWLIIFILFLCGWGYVAFYSVKNGDLNALLAPIDSMNQKCGVDSRVYNEPYLFFFNLQKCIDPLVPIYGCPTPQICVYECPQETFIFDDYEKRGNSAINEIRRKLLCLPSVNKERDIKNIGDAKTLVLQERCARWYVKSKSFLRRCVWDSSSLCEIPPHLLRTRRELDDYNQTRSMQYNNQNYNNTNINRNQRSNTDTSLLSPLDKMIDKAAKYYLSSSPSSSSFEDRHLRIYDQQRSSRDSSSYPVNEQELKCDRYSKLGAEIIVEKMRRTDTYLSRFVGNFLAHFYNGTDAQEFGQKVVEDILSSWVIVCIALIFAMIASLLFITIMRWLAAPMVWLSLIGVLAALAYGIYESVLQYIHYKDVVRVPHHSPNLISTLRNWFEDKNTWLVLIIVLIIIFLIIFLMVIFLRKRIVIAIALIKEGSKAVATVFSTVFFPIFPWMLHIGVIASAIIIGLYLASIGEPSFKVIGPVNENSTFNDCRCRSANTSLYRHGSSCHPIDFNTYCAEKGIFGCINAGCYFDKLNSPSIVGYFHAYNVIGFLWVAFFITAFSQMVLAATFATWYWTFHKSDVPYFILTKAFCRTFFYHMGTLAIGSLVITICRIIRLILEYIDQKLKKYDNEFTKCMLCCCKCFFWCLENFLRFLNKNAYIMCAIHGKGFCASAKDAFNLLMRNVLRVVTLDKVTDFVFFMSKILLTICAGTGIYFYLDNYIELYQLHYVAVPTTIVVIGTYLITTLFFGVYSMAVDTLFLCFLEDSERNDGSPEKPYFMSKQLMKILGKHNEVPRSRYN